MEINYPPPRGLICPIVTPLKRDRTLDSVSLGRLLQYVEKTVDGILLCDPVWGEGLKLPADIRLDLVATAIETLKGRLPLLITLTGNSLKSTRTFKAELSLIVESASYPAPIFWVDYPLCYHGNRELPQMYQKLMADSRNPWILGNQPDLVKQFRGLSEHKNIRTGVLKKIVKFPAIKGIVFTGSLKRSLNFHAAFRERKDFIFYDGDEATFLKNPGTGGLVAGGSNLLPGKWRDIMRSSLNRYDTERQYYSHQSTILETGMLLHAFYSLYADAPACRMKRILKRVGIIDGDTPITQSLPAEAAWEKELTTFLEKYDIDSI